MFRNWLILVIMVVVGIGGYVVVSKSYPVVLVNWRPISVRTFYENTGTAQHYYEKLYERYKKNAQEIQSEAAQQEISRAVLEKLIEDNLIYEELKRRMSAQELSTLLNKKIAEAIRQKDIQKGVEMLYGISLAEFSEKTLKPLAAREILEDRLKLENKKIEDWLKTAKENAKITFFLPNFSWDSIKGIITE